MAHSIDLKTATIHYNSDLSGNVHIVSKVDATKIEIAGEDLLEFIGEYLKTQTISKIESISGTEFVKLLNPSL